MIRLVRRLCALRPSAKFLSFSKLVVTIILAGWTLRYGCLMVDMGHPEMGGTVILCVLWLLWHTHQSQ